MTYRQSKPTKLEQAADDTVAAILSGKPLRLGIDFSTKEQREYLRMVKSMLADVGIDPSRIQWDTWITFSEGTEK